MKREDGLNTGDSNSHQDVFDRQLAILPAPSPLGFQKIYLDNIHIVDIDFSVACLGSVEAISSASGRIATMTFRDCKFVMNEDQMQKFCIELARFPHLLSLQFHCRRSIKKEDFSFLQKFLLLNPGVLVIELHGPLSQYNLKRLSSLITDEIFENNHFLQVVYANSFTVASRYSQMYLNGVPCIISEVYDSLKFLQDALPNVRQVAEYSDHIQFPPQNNHEKKCQLILLNMLRVVLNCFVQQNIEQRAPKDEVYANNRNDEVVAQLQSVGRIILKFFARSKKHHQTNWLASESVRAVTDQIVIEYSKGLCLSNIEQAQGREYSTKIFWLSEITRLFNSPIDVYIDACKVIIQPAEKKDDVPLKELNYLMQLNDQYHLGLDWLKLQLVNSFTSYLHSMRPDALDYTTLDWPIQSITADYPEFNMLYATHGISDYRRVVTETVTHLSKNDLLSDELKCRCFDLLLRLCHLYIESYPQIERYPLLSRLETEQLLIRYLNDIPSEDERRYHAAEDAIVRIIRLGMNHVLSLESSEQQMMLLKNLNVDQSVVAMLKSINVYLQNETWMNRIFKFKQTFQVIQSLRNLLYSLNRVDQNQPVPSALPLEKDEITEFTKQPPSYKDIMGANSDVGKDWVLLDDDKSNTAEAEDRPIPPINYYPPTQTMRSVPLPPEYERPLAPPETSAASTIASGFTGSPVISRSSSMERLLDEMPSVPEHLVAISDDEDSVDAEASVETKVALNG